MGTILIVTYLAASNVAFLLMRHSQKATQDTTLKYGSSCIIGYLLTTDFMTYFLLYKTQKSRMLLFIYIHNSDLDRTRSLLRFLGLLCECV